MQAQPLTTLKLGSARSPRGSRVSTLALKSFLECCMAARDRAALLQVAASEVALAYALTGGLIRVVNLENGERTLLRSHTADVCDVQVCSQAESALFRHSVGPGCRCASKTCCAQLPWTEPSFSSSWTWCVVARQCSLPCCVHAESPGLGVERFVVALI